VIRSTLTLQYVEYFLSQITVLFQSPILVNKLEYDIYKQLLTGLMDQLIKEDELR
jgi:hypothetical protein